MKYDGILFDLDGTLWDATEAIRVSWAMALESVPDVEAPPTREQLERVMGMTADNLMATLFPKLSKERHRELFDACCKAEENALHGVARPAAQEKHHRCAERCHQKGKTGACRRPDQRLCHSGSPRFLPRAGANKEYVIGILSFASIS